jgi:opacity protein-like surface antigen
MQDRKEIHMRRCELISAVVALALFSALAASGQSAPALSGGNQHLQAGVEFSAFDTDVAFHPWEYGVGAYLDIDGWHRLGIELEGRTIQFDEQDNTRQDIASGGFRYVLHRGSRFRPYAKALAGLGSADFYGGTYKYHPDRHHDTFSTVTAGGGLDYAVSPHFILRADYEYQFWFDYGRGALGGKGTVNPTGVSLGAGWRF